jgi:SAM-dependent methyltransferase
LYIIEIMSAVAEKLSTARIPECPLCNRRGEICYAELEDSVWFAPGKWAYRICHRCQILWLDPRPTKECFNLIYPPNYLTHGEPVNPLSARSDFLANLMLQIKLEVLHRSYGYSLSSSNFLGRFIGIVVAHIPVVKRWVGYTVRFLHARKGNLLDVGCGNGEFLLTMSKLGWQVKGIEPDPVSTSLSRKAGIEIYQGSVESAPLEHDSFDAITMNHVIEHLSDPIGTVKKLVSTLRPGGLFVSISPNPSSSLARWFGGAWRGLEPPRHFILFSPNAMACLAEQCGLESEIWTTTRNSNWMARESISIARYENAAIYRGLYLPTLVAAGCKILTGVNKKLGEEVVLVARKK